MVKNEKKLMNENDLNKFAEISPKLLEIKVDLVRPVKNKSQWNLQKNKLIDIHDK